MKVLAQDTQGNQIIDGDGWELCLADGWYQVGYDDHTQTDYLNLSSELDIDEDLATEFVQWLLNVQPSSIHLLSYQEVHSGFCNDCNYVVSCYPVDSDYFKINFELYKVIRKSR